MQKFPAIRYLPLVAFLKYYAQARTLQHWEGAFKEGSQNPTTFPLCPKLSTNHLRVIVSRSQVMYIHGLLWPLVANINALLYAIKLSGNPSFVRMVFQLALKLGMS